MEGQQTSDNQHELSNGWTRSNFVSCFSEIKLDKPLNVNSKVLTDGNPYIFKNCLGMLITKQNSNCYESKLSLAT